MNKPNKLFNLVRLIHSSSANLHPRRRGANPGISQLIKTDESFKSALTEDAEGFGNLETDLMDVHRSHRQHQQELANRAEMIKNIMVKNKYFKEPQTPSFLTYAEKEQIRLLHSRDPEEWSVERLAESFPATIEIVQKVLEAKWKPYSAKKIVSYNNRVMENWRKLRNGDELQHLPAELREHLAKFTQRNFQDIRKQNLQAAGMITATALPQPQTKDFSLLITSCKKYAESEANKTNKSDIKSNPFANNLDKESDTYLLGSIKNKRKLRLQDLKLKNPEALKLTETNKQTTKSLEQLAVEEFGNTAGTGVLPNSKYSQHSSKALENVNSFIHKFQRNEVVITPAEQKQTEVKRIKDRIYIPRKVWRKDAIFRLKGDDCYYDDDGEFLYRVPGMTDK